MNIVLFGAAGFIGTNLIMELARDPENSITAVDRSIEFFRPLDALGIPGLQMIEADLTLDADYESLVRDQDIVYHLISTTVPTTSNRAIAEELKGNVVLSANLFEACVHQKVKKVVFLSSGGTVYGKEAACPLAEETPTNPITSYGVQKITIEKLLYLYHYMYGLDYRIIRLANPYGPYQRPNGILGAVTTFIYKALRGEEIQVFGDGSVIRDFIYIDDAVKGILKIVNGANKHHTYNLGSGYGTSINQVIDTIQDVLGLGINVKHIEARKVDVPINYLDIGRFETDYGELNPVELKEGIRKTADFMKNYYHI